MTENRWGWGDWTGGEHYRKMAGKFRELARHCRFGGTHGQLLELAMNYDRRAEYIDRGANGSAHPSVAAKVMNACPRTLNALNQKSAKALIQETRAPEEARWSTPGAV